MTARGFVRFAWITLAVTVAVIVWGAVVRATGSGAGCGSHWPLCNGSVVPLSSRASTIIEFTHRLTSGGAMLLSLGLALAARRVFPAGHPARAWALAAFGFMLIEAGIGAGLVLLGLVENNTSALRAGYITVHLVNTMVLVAAITGATWWGSQPTAATHAPGRRSRLLFLVMLLMVVVAASGAIVALGDTLFPAGSLAEGLAADFGPGSHFLVRLRTFHPVLAVSAALVLLSVARRDPWFRAEPGASMRPVILGLLALQVGLGVINVLMLAPLPMQIAHLLGSNALWIAIVWSWVGSFDTTRS